MCSFAGKKPEMIERVTVVLFSLTALAVTGTTGTPDSTEAGNFKLRLIHTNDMHARFEQVSRSAGKCSDFEAARDSCYGGFARVHSAILKEIQRAQSENVPILSLNAGDTYQGTVWYAFFKWRVVLHFLKKLKIDAMSLGNHEFDDGIKGLTPFLNDIKVPVLAANIDMSREPEMSKTPIKKSVVLERGGKKIGIIGYLTPETAVLADTGKLQFEDEIKVLKVEAKRLKSQGVDIIFALGHSGYDVDLQIGKEVEDVDVIVGGHSHSFLYTGKPPDSDVPVDVYPVIITQKSGRKVAMVQAYAFTKYLGILNMTFDKNGELLEASGNPILLDTKIPEDQEIKKEVMEWKAKLDSSLKEKVGVMKVYHDGFKCRFYECNLGNLIADSYIYHGVKQYSGPFWTNAPIAIQQGGGIRASINASASNGVVTKEDIITVMPFFSSLSVVEINGKYLLEGLEWSVARYDPERKLGRGEFLQVSGIRIVFNLKKPPGSRVVSVRVRCGYCHEPKYENLQTDRNYTVIMPTFLKNGGDSFFMFKKHAVELYQFDGSDTNVTMNYIKERGLLYHGEEDRITFVENSGFNLKSNYFIVILLFILLVK